jgi:ferrochelatase
MAGVDNNTTGKEAWVLINVGTPDNPSTCAVRRYLREFLNDPEVIDLPWLTRKLLVNLIIVPFRTPRSAKKYQWLWTENGSPLLHHMNELVKKLQLLAGDNIDVFGAMRYGNPSLEKLLEDLKNTGYSSITFLPLYPQFASSTSGSVIQLINSRYKGEFTIVDQFYNHQRFIETFSNIISKYNPDSFDHILFSYHGLPLRQIQKCHPGTEVKNCTCETEMPLHGSHCYRAACYATTRLLAASAGLAKHKYSTSFQSRLSKNWMTPFTDKRLIELARIKAKKVLVVPASFVADCLETSLEIGEEYRLLFLEEGGEKLVMTESLNSSPEWTEALYDILGEPIR